MGGGLLQLVAYGAQDAYLSGNPQITFFKGLFKRHTNFAMEPFRVNFTGQAAWGTKQSAVMGRHADLMYSTYLEVVLDAGYYNNDQGRLGYNLLQYVELEIGGQVIDRQYGEFLFLWDALTSDYVQSLKLTEMVGATGFGESNNANAVYIGGEKNCNNGSGRPSLPKTTLYIPFFFWYTRSPGAALPLIALQYHEVRINMLWNDAKFIAGNFNKVNLVPQPIQAAIYVDYIYLDTEERRRMAQQSHEYLIEQTQYNEDKGISSYNNRIDLTFNHPVKELIWVVQPAWYTDCKLAANSNHPIIYKLVGDYSSVVDDAKFNISVVGSTYIDVEIAYSGSGYTPGAVTLTIDGDNLGGLTPANDLTVNVTVDSNGAVTNVVSFTGTAKYNATTRLQPFTYDHSAVYEQWIQINGQDRMDKRYGDYFNKVQTYQHHTGILPGPGAYMYSFALRPEEHQPSGTCNFSRIDTATIVMTISGEILMNQDTDNTLNVRVYAINYNILRVMSGMGGLAYSN